MKRLFFILIVLLLISLLLQCRKEPGGLGNEPPAATDTTSHDFVFEAHIIGDFNTYLTDVAVINENDIWAVGRIMRGDSM